MKIKLLNDDPYAELICRYFSTTFNKVITPNAKELLEILTIILIGDKDIRLGPVPNPEQLVVIRKTISKAIELNVPIPILIAWGGRKTDATKGVDVAEISALHQLMRLQDCVRKYYQPGLQINIRIEDTGADWIYRGEDNIFTNVEKYSSQFALITTMLSEGYNITPIRESSLMDRYEYFDKSLEYSNLLSVVITSKIVNTGSDGELLTTYMNDLAVKGWKGDLPMEQINHYIDRYKILYPDLPMTTYVQMAADYLGGAKARYDLNGRAEPKSNVGSFISISFIPPIPGSPVSMFSNVLYYRTVPMKDGRTHIAPWRAKGYLEIGTDNSVKVKVTSWSNTELLEELTSTQVEIIDDNNKTCISADYVAKDFTMPFQLPFTI